jgi:hypothetical protein
MRSLVKLLILVLFCSNAYSQDTAFAHTYGSYGDDAGRSLVQLPDSGFVIVGSTGSFGNGSSDVYIIRIDSLGKYIWSKVYGGSNTEWANSIKYFNDGTCIIVGYTNTFGNGGYDVYVLKINLLGDTLWTNTFGGSGWDFGYSVQRTFDGGYIIAGETYSNSNGENDMLLLKISENGEWEWQKNFGGALQDYAKDVTQLSDSGYVIIGATESKGKGMFDAFLVRTNKFGDTLFTKTYGEVKNDVAHSLYYNKNDQTLYLAGYTENFGAVNRDFYIVRTNLMGDTIWTHRINGPDGDEEWFSINTDNNGDYLLTGYSYSIIGAGYEDVFFMKITPNKQILQLTTYGWLEYERGYAIIPTYQGGHAIAATTNSFGNGNNDVFFIKTKSDGYYSYQNNPAVVYHDTNHVHLAINNVQNSNLIYKIYPQPASEYLQIDFDFLKNQTFSAHLIIFSNTGKIVYNSEKISEHSIQIPLSEISSGLYFMQIEYTTGDSASAIKKISSKISVVK